MSQITNVGTIERIALSGDGRFLAEVKNDNGQRTLWVRNTATNTDTQILGAFANWYMGIAFSPDGNYLYFVRPTSGEHYHKRTVCHAGLRRYAEAVDL